MYSGFVLPRLGYSGARTVRWWLVLLPRVYKFNSYRQPMPRRKLLPCGLGRPGAVHDRAVLCHHGAGGAHRAVRSRLLLHGRVCVRNADRRRWGGRRRVSGWPLLCGGQFCRCTMPRRQVFGVYRECGPRQLRRLHGGDVLRRHWRLCAHGPVCCGIPLPWWPVSCSPSPQYL